MPATDNRRKSAVEDLEAELRRMGIAATVTELDSGMGAVTVVAASYVDFVLARAELKLKGLTAVQP